MAKVALLIGINEYGLGLKPLPAAPRDVAAIQEVLQNSEMGGFDVVKPLINPNHWEMEREIELWFRDRQRDDLVLLFFSGHGIKDERGDLYLAASNTQKDEHGELIKSTAVAASFIHNCSRDSKSKRQVLILDCCFSGAFGSLVARDDSSIDLERQLGAEGRVVLASTSAIQYSFEEKGIDLSIYTRYLVEGIQTGVADQDNDGFISVQELHDYACRKVQDTAPGMSPKIIVLKDEGFDIKIATAKVTDPKLKYHREVERYAKRGEIPEFGCMILKTLSSQLKLSPEEIAEIEETVLRPYRDRLDNIQHYKEAFAAAVKAEFPMSENTRRDLKHYQEMLGLRREDVTSIEAEIAPSPEPQTTPLPEPIKETDVQFISSQPEIKLASSLTNSPSQTAGSVQKSSETFLEKPDGVVPVSNKPRHMLGVVIAGITLVLVAGMSYLGYHFWAEQKEVQQKLLWAKQQEQEAQRREQEAKQREQEKVEQLGKAQQQIEAQKERLLEAQKERLPSTLPSTVGVVCIANQTGRPVSFQYRWGTTEASPWLNAGVLLPGNWGVLQWPYRVPNENRSPPLQILFNTNIIAGVNWRIETISGQAVTAMPVADCSRIGSKGYAFRLASPTSLDLVKPFSSSFE